MLIIDSTSSRCQLNIGPRRMQLRVLVGAIVFVVEVVGRCEQSSFRVVGGAAQQAMSIVGGLNWKPLVMEERQAITAKWTRDGRRVVRLTGRFD